MMMWLRLIPVLLLLPVMVVCVIWSNYSRISLFYPVSLIISFFLLRILSEKKQWIESFRSWLTTSTYYYLLVMSFTACISLLPSLVRGAFPLPMYHDEFAYLLAADTFAHGKMSNPTPPGWQHFESYHINLQPAYCSKYQPGMGLVLAVGQLLGHPYLGVFLTLVLASLCWAWMCKQWLPVLWAYLGSLLGCMMLITISSDCYFVGGALATIPSSLLLGMLRLPVRTLRWWHGTLMGLSLVIYFWTRPFEGALATLFLGSAILLNIHRQAGWRHFILALLPGSLLAIVPAGWFQAQFNHACTGSYLKMPYLLHEEQYGMTPLFLVQHPREDLVKYHHAEFVRFHQSMVDWHQAQQPTNIHPGVFRYKFETIWLYSLGLLWPVVLCMLGRLWPYCRLRMLLLFWGVMVTCHVFLTTWVLPHYMGPGLPAWGLLLVFSIQFCVRERSSRWQQLAWLLLIASCIQFTLERTMEVVSSKPEWLQQRQSIQTQLQHDPGMHLVFIVYSASHKTGDEWVYNLSHLETQQVVWARSMDVEKDRDLIRKYPQRKYWLLNIASDGSIQLKAYQP